MTSHSIAIIIVGGAYILVPSLNTPLPAMAHIDVETRYRVQFEFEQCQNISLVARKLHLDRKTVQRWVGRRHSPLKVATKKGQGRKAKLDDAASASAVDMLLSKRFTGCKDVAKQLHDMQQTPGDAPVHRCTVLRHAKAHAVKVGEPIYCCMRMPQKQLSESTKLARLQFCNDNKERNWKQVMFTDRKKFHFTFVGAKVRHVEWLRAGHKRTASKVNHAMVVNVYGGITTYGATRLICVAGTSKMATEYKNKKGQAARNITSSEYMKVVSFLLQEGKRLFAAQGISNWILQQDNDPTHKKAATTALQAWNQSNSGNHVSLLPAWPPNSPDLSPIENVWAYVQRQVNAEGCKTFDEFKLKVMHTFHHLPQQMINNLYRSMTSRLVDCIAVGGDKTKY